MKLQTKLILCISAAAVLAMLMGVFVQKRVIDDVEIDRTLESMRSTLLQAETVRAIASRQVSDDSFDFELLAEEAKQADDLRKTAFYRTIPVVVSWRSVDAVAKEFGYDFRVVKRGARNPENEPTAEEAKVLDTLRKTDADEYFFDDAENDQLVYARPIRLTQDCLVCHGDPAESLTGDGRDVLGFKMEGWKADEMHGAFVLRADKRRMRAAGTAAFFGGAGTTAAFTIPSVVLLVVGVVIYLKRSLLKPLGEKMKQVSKLSGANLDAAESISHTSAVLLDGTSDQAASVEETSATLEEISSVSRGNAGAAAEVQDAVSKTCEVVKRGSSCVTEMKVAIDAIGESSNRISEIIHTIDEIAFQTNLLALNAAVEAARAGEAGAGFAVVADEVRSLAQKCAEAAKASEGLLQDSVQKSASGMGATNSVVAFLSEIETDMLEVKSAVDHIVEASDQQHLGVEQINIAMHKIEQVSQSSTQSSGDLAHSASDLSAQAHMALRLVQEMEQIVFGIRMQQPVRTSKPVGRGRVLRQDKPPESRREPLESMWN